MAMNDILPDNADAITNAFLSQFGADDNDQTVYLDKKPSKEDEDADSPRNKKEENGKSKSPNEESDEQLDFEIYDSDADGSDEDANGAPIITSNKSSNSGNANGHGPINTIITKINTKTTNDIEDVKETNKTNDIIVTGKETPLIDDTKNENINIDEDTKEKSKIKQNNNNNNNNSKDVGSRTMEQWLNRDNLIVHPVWIGNLPRGTTVNQLRHFVESQVGRVLVSIHISVKQPSNNERTYAFLNLPTAEKQLLAVTLLDGKIFTQEKLIVRPKRPSKFPQSFFGSSPISEHFKHFRDCVVPAILANPTINLNVTSVRKILEQNHINIDHLPNRVWCVQCTLVPQCHRTYCSFYHCHQEKELGRIISILAAQNCGDNSLTEGGLLNANGKLGGSNENGPMDAFSIEHKKNLAAANNPNTIRSRHTLLIQGLPRSITSKKIEETFEVFGEIDNVIVNPDHTCYVRMKRSQDARKIVHLFKYNHAGVIVDFAPYGASKMTSLVNKKNNNDVDKDKSSNKLPMNKPVMNNYATAPNHNYNNNNNNNNRLNLVNNRSHDGMNNNRGGNNHNNNNNLPTLPVQMQRPQFTNSQTMNSMNMYNNNQYNNNNNNNNNNYGQQYQQQQHKQNNNTNKGLNPRDALRLNMHTQSEPIPQQYTNTMQPNNMYGMQMNNMNHQQQQQQQYMNNMGHQQQRYNQQMQMNNTNNGMNNMPNNMIGQMAPTPQQYTQYYNQMMQQQQRYYQQQMNNQQQPHQQQQQYYQQSNQSWNGYNNMPNNNPNNTAFSPTNGQNNNYAFSHSSTNNALSPIAQTPTNMGANMTNMTNITPTNQINQMTNGINNMNMNMNTNVTSPPITSPRIFSPTQQQTTNNPYSTNNTTSHTSHTHTSLPARQSLGLKNSYSTNDAYIQQQTSNPYTQQAQQQKHIYSSGTGDDTYNKYYNTNYNVKQFDNIIQQHTAKNQQHKQWINQHPIPTNNTHKLHEETGHTGAMPNAPQLGGPIPEPDLHFQLSAHDFPLSPTSALKDKQ